jgi:hypothetical protein
VLFTTEVLGLRITRIFTHLPAHAVDGTCVNVNTAVSVSGRVAAETGTQPPVEGQAEG